MSCDVRDEKLLVAKSLSSRLAFAVACPAMGRRLPWIHGIDGLACLDSWTI